VDALQAIFKAWNQSTPNIAENLPGWKLTGSNYTYNIPFPCFGDVPWKGVLCLQYVDPTSNANVSTLAVVVGL
jgi:hypothetical protein